MPKRKNMNLIPWLLTGAAILFFVYRNDFLPLPSNAIFDLSKLDSQYGAQNVQRLTNLYYVVSNSIDPTTGQALTAVQQQLLLAQALQESGLFTDNPNYKNVDQLNNYAGIARNGDYVGYPDLKSFVNDWLDILSTNNQPIEAVTVPDFVTRLKANNYFTDNINTYMNNVQTYFNILNNTAV